MHFPFAESVDLPQAQELSSGWYERCDQFFRKNAVAPSGPSLSLLFCNFHHTWVTLCCESFPPSSLWFWSAPEMRREVCGPCFEKHWSKRRDPIRTRHFCTYLFTSSVSGPGAWQSHNTRVTTWAQVKSPSLSLRFLSRKVTWFRF